MEEREFNIRVLGLRDKMFRFARSILQRRDDAEDVTHDTLERLWRRREGLDVCRNLEAFAMTAVRNGCYDRLRRVQTMGEEALSNLRTDGEAGRNEAAEVIAEAMRQLPAKQRATLHLKDIEGYETREIAEMFGVEENQIRTILSRARKSLREEIEKMDYETYGKRDQRTAQEVV